MWAEISTAYGVHSGIRIGVDTEELIQRGPNLLAIVSGLAGYDSINVPACTEAGVLVCNQTGMGNEPVAEHVTAGMLMLSHKTLLALTFILAPRVTFEYRLVTQWLKK